MGGHAAVSQPTILHMPNKTHKVATHCAATVVGIEFKREVPQVCKQFCKWNPNDVQLQLASAAFDVQFPTQQTQGLKGHSQNSSPCMG